MCAYVNAYTSVVVYCFCDSGEYMQVDGNVHNHSKFKSLCTSPYFRECNGAVVGKKIILQCVYRLEPKWHEDIIPSTCSSMWAPPRNYASKHVDALTLKLPPTSC